jgi:hypothetical protein
MAVRWHAVAAITASRLLRAELGIVQQHAGWEFEYTQSIPYARRFARQRPMIIVGADLVARVRTPLACGGVVLVASTDFNDLRMFAHAGRIGAAYIVGLPTSSPWLVDLLLQSHRWCSMATPHPPVHGGRLIGGE